MRAIGSILVSIALCGCGGSDLETETVRLELPEYETNISKNTAELEATEAAVSLNKIDYDSLVSDVVNQASASIKQKTIGSTRPKTKLKLVRPSPKEIAAFDERFRHAQEEADLRVRDQGGSYSVTGDISAMNYSDLDLERLGYWFISNSRSYLDYEKGAWLLLLRGSVLDYWMKRNDITAMTSDRSLHGGKAAEMAAEHYMNADGNEFNLTRALGLHLAAGKAGIQSSYINAGYIQRHWVQTPAQKKNGIDHVALKAYARNLFDYAQQHCEDDRYMERALYPWTEAMCSEARKQYMAAKSAHDAIKPNYYDNRWLSRMNTWDGSLERKSRLLIEGIAASSLGADDGSNSNTEPGEYEWKQPDMHLGEMLLWVK